MKLTKEDKRVLKKLGHKEEDFAQIEKAMNKSSTTYGYSKGQGYNLITRERAVELLGRRKWVSGISRSAFHWNAVQLVNDSNELSKVSFDSSKLFR